MEADAQLERVLNGPGVACHRPLDVDRCAACRRGIGEDEEEGVSLGANHLPRVLGHDAPYERLVFGIEGVIASVERPHEIHRTLDIGPQERDRSLGERHRLRYR